MRLLLVEDHARLATTLASGLRREGFAVDLAFDGREAIDRVSLVPYDVVILDRDLPVIHGDDVCRAIVRMSAETQRDSAPEDRDSRPHSGPRVLMLTAANSVRDQIEGLDLGADDYLPKPFAFAILVARVRTLARRTGLALPPVIEVGDIRLDPAQHVAQRSGRTLNLRPKEFAVLECLLRARGAVLTSEQLLYSVWDEMADPFSKTVKATMSRLRAKLGDPPVIETVASGGYRIADR